MTDDFDGALDALTHEIRVAILRELSDADRPISFTELKSRTDVTDAGRFNYHLSELRDHYLREAADGYELNYRGERLLVVADQGVRVDDAAPADDACPVCGDPDCDRLIHVHLDSSTV